MVGLNDRLYLIYFSFLYLLGIGRLSKRIDPVAVSIRISRIRRLRVAIKLIKIAVTYRGL